MSLNSAIDVAATALSAQRLRMELASANMANAETTRTPEGGPYRRKDVIFAEDPSVGSFSSELNSALGSNVSGVAVNQVKDDRAHRAWKAYASAGKEILHG